MIEESEVSTASSSVICSRSSIYGKRNARSNGGSRGGCTQCLTAYAWMYDQEMHLCTNGDGLEHVIPRQSNTFGGCLMRGDVVVQIIGILFLELTVKIVTVSSRIRNVYGNNVRTRTTCIAMIPRVILLNIMHCTSLTTSFIAWHTHTRARARDAPP